MPIDSRESQLVADIDRYTEGTEFEGWRVLASLFSNDEQPVVRAVLVEAPSDVETGKPFAFVVKNEDGEVSKILRNSDAFHLVIEVAHQWSTTDELAHLDAVNIAELTCVFAFQQAPVLGLGKLLATLHTFALNMLSSTEDDASLAASASQS